MNKVVCCLALVVFCLSLQNVAARPAASSARSRDRAEKFLRLALDEYRKAVQENPGDRQLRGLYEVLVDAVYGRGPAAAEKLLLYQRIGLDSAVDEVLTGLTPADRESALQYLDQSAAKAGPIEKTTLYRTALLLSPNDARRWYALGKQYLAIQSPGRAVESLEKADALGLADPDLFLLLAEIYRSRGDLDRSKDYANRGLQIRDDASFHRILADIYAREKYPQAAKAEQEKARLLTGRGLWLKLPGKIAEQFTRPPVPEEKPGEPIPGVEPYDLLVVSKKEQAMFVYHFDGGTFKRLERFVCTTGKNPGQKRVKGDGRTPEGTFLLRPRVQKPLPAKYGVAAFPLAYPNVLDRMFNRNGDGIWMHGTPIARPPYNSEGCVVLNDRDLSRVMKYVKPGETFVHVAETPALSLSPDLKETLDGWKTAWESRDPAKYLEYYDDHFRSDGKDKQRWSAYKTKVIRGTSFIKVDISDLRFIPYGRTPLGDVVIARFKQTYTSNDFTSRSAKTLYLVKTGEKWRILSEEAI